MGGTNDFIVDNVAHSVIDLDTNATWDAESKALYYTSRQGLPPTSPPPTYILITVNRSLDSRRPQLRRLPPTLELHEPNRGSS